MKKLTRKNLVFLGAPGAGKGTVSNAMLAKYVIEHISTGDILRGEVAKRTPAGIEAEAIMKAGKLVPDALVAGMVRSRIGEADCRENGFILDGFPRTVAQADLLAAALKELGTALDAVVYFKVPEDVLIQRLTARQNCRGCDAIYNKIFKPSKVEGICDKCGSQLYQRPDDSLETAKARLKVFAEQTQPLIDYYEKLGLLLTIEDCDSDAIMARIAKELE